MMSRAMLHHAMFKSTHKLLRVPGLWQQLDVVCCSSRRLASRFPNYNSVANGIAATFLLPHKWDTLTQSELKHKGIVFESKASSGSLCSAVLTPGLGCRVAQRPVSIPRNWHVPACCFRTSACLAVSQAPACPDPLQSKVQPKTVTSDYYFLAAIMTLVTTMILGYNYLSSDDASGNAELAQEVNYLISLSKDPGRAMLADAEVLLYNALVIASHDARSADSVLLALDALAGIFYQQEKYVEAEAAFKDVVRLLLRDGHSETSDLFTETSLKLANMYANVHRDYQASAGYRRCLRVCRTKLEQGIERGESLDVSVANYVMCLENYGRYLISRKRYLEAQPLIMLALETARRLPSDNESLCKVADLQNSLAMVLNLQGNQEQSHQVLQQAEIFCLQNKLSTIIPILQNKAMLLLDQGRLEEAEQVLNDALSKAKYIPEYTADINKALETVAVHRKHLQKDEFHIIETETTDSLDDTATATDCSAN